MLVKELRQKNIEELKNLLSEKRKEIANKKFEVSIGKEKNTSVIRSIKKEIARIKTVIREKEVLNEQ